MNPVRNIWIPILAWCLNCMCLSEAVANSFAANQRNILPGGRAPFMGGAFTAIANDSTGAYYNPAGLAYVPGKEVSISGISYLDHQLVHRGAVDGQDFTEHSSGFTTSFIGGLFDTGRLKLGWSIIQLDRKDIDQNESFLVNENSRVYTRTHQESNSYEWYGASLATHISKDLSVGFSGFYYLRNILVSNHNMSYFLTEDDSQVVDQKYLTRNEGLILVLGGMLKKDRWSFGVAYRRGRSIDDSTLLTYDEIYYAPSQWDAPAEEQDPYYQDCFQEEKACVVHSQFQSDALSELNPQTWSLGVAWNPFSAVTLSFDALYHQGVSSPYKNSGNGDLYDTLNYSFGSEFKLGQFVLRSGVFTNNSMYKKPTAGGVNQPMSVDYVGYAGSIGFMANSRDAYMGIVKQVGNGHSQIVSNSQTIQKVQATSLFYNVGYTYYF